MPRMQINTNINHLADFVLPVEIVFAGQNLHFISDLVLNRKSQSYWLHFLAQKISVQLGNLFVYVEVDHARAVFIAINIQNSVFLHNKAVRRNATIADNFPVDFFTGKPVLLS